MQMTVGTDVAYRMIESCEPTSVTHKTRLATLRTTLELAVTYGLSRVQLDHDDLVVLSGVTDKKTTRTKKS